MISKKDIKFWNEFKNDKLEASQFCDDENKIFPVDTEESAVNTAMALVGKDVSKVYDANERLHMFARLLKASENFTEETRTKIKNIVGGTGMDKIYTEDEMLQKAKELAEKQVADEKAKSGIDEQINSLTAENEKLAKNLEEAAKLATERETKIKAFEDQIAKEQAEKQAAELAAKRLAELQEVDASIVSNDELVAYLKSADDNAFATFKKLMANAIEAAKKDMKDDKNKDDKKNCKASLVEGSQVIPNTVATAEADIDILDKGFAALMTR